MCLDHDFQLLHYLPRHLHAGGNGEEKESLGQRFLAGFKPHDVAVVRIHVAHPANVAKLDGHEGLAGRGKHHGHMTIR